MKFLSIAVAAALLLNGCSMFVNPNQQISVMSNVPTAQIYVNGELVGQGSGVTASVRRNKNVQIMATADGYYSNTKGIDTHLSTTGILDIIGIFLYIVPVIGLFFPGSRTLDEHNVTIMLQPDKSK
jgi:hypothetical protein